MPTVLHRLAQWAAETPEMPAQQFKSGSVWSPISAQEYRDRIHYAALFLESRGITKSSIGCIFSTNCTQWVHLDLSVLLLGAKSAGIYPNSTSKEALHILNHTEASVLSVQNKEFFNKLANEPGSKEAIDRLKIIISFDNDTSFSDKAIAYTKVIEEGKTLASQKAKSFADYLKGIDPKAPAFMIYTSGTTGNPKGALLSHDNLVFTSDCAINFWKLPQNATGFSFLPLCHVAEKLQNIGVGISLRSCISFCTQFDKVAIELPEIQPTLLLSVPRLWEKMMEGVLHKIGNSTGSKKKLALWALDVGAKIGQAKYSHSSHYSKYFKTLPFPTDWMQYQIADRLVLSKIKKALGLGKAERLASGAAALPAHVARWFRCLGLELLEDYGQTESTGVICMTDPGIDCAGTVGKPVPGMEVKIAEDGEILTKGRHVFLGYYKDEAATRATMHGEWLQTGDLGEMNDRGLIRIRGRKKEVMKTSGGKMVAPLPIEETLKAAPIISQVCMVGDGRKYLSALITLTENYLKELKDKLGSSEGKVIEHGEVVERVKQHIDDLNRSLASYEQIKRFTILSKEFSIEAGEMTPTLKMKRMTIEARYSDIIDKMYND